jgi:hypothetical protein
VAARPTIPAALGARARHANGLLDAIQARSTRSSVGRAHRPATRGRLGLGVLVMRPPAEAASSVAHSHRSWRRPGCPLARGAAALVSRRCSRQRRHPGHDLADHARANAGAAPTARSDLRQLIGRLAAG